MKIITIFSTILLLFSVSSALAKSDTKEQSPIIDVHFHTFTGKTFPERRLNGRIVKTTKVSKQEALAEGLRMLRKYNIYAVVSGPAAELVDEWIAAAPERFIPALQIPNVRLDKTYLDDIRQRAANGNLEVLGEVAFQYEGISPESPAYDVYFSLAAELDIPIAVHLGPGPLGVHRVRPNFRVDLGNPLLLESALNKYPDLRIYVMHAGWPFLNEMMGILYTYPNVYVDLSSISSSRPRAEYYRYLKALVDAGFADRIMFGSDPDETLIEEIITESVERIEDAEFLTEKQKRDIFFNNAVDFFELDPERFR